MWNESFFRAQPVEAHPVGSRRPMPLRVIGLLSGPKGHLIRPRQLLSSAREAEYRKALTLLESFRSSREIAPVVNGNLFAFLGVRDKLTGLMATPRSDRSEKSRLYQELNRTFSNLLSSIRLYRDHTKRRLTHSYGRGSLPVCHFDQVWYDALKQTFAFGFIWEFRNYVQHVGMPFDVASVSSADPTQPTSGRAIELGIAKGTLLRYEKWGPLEPQLRSMGEVIAVQDYVPAAFAKLNAIDSTLVEQERPLLLEAGKAMISILRGGFDAGAYPGTMEVADGTLPSGLVSFHLAPIEMLDFLGLASAANTPEGLRTKLNDAA